MAYDGIVSRYLNRPISRPAARALAPTPVTPNAVTLFTLALAIATGAMLALGWNIAGGIAIQAVSIIDGVDGELARLRIASTRFGEVLDAITDRYADAVMLGGMTIYAVRFEDFPMPEVVGMLALAGALSISYSRARIEASLPDVPANMDALLGLASRDVRSLLMAIGAILGQCYIALCAIAIITTLTVAWRLIYLRSRAAK
ncbi:MAG: CDP-alcohol phosphatidyltransferase family protein [Dehalococcoidia bacterium]|nr:CDP-alcohol phosphatidyltransferase family protein [Dehalococcoidia bacterium]